MAQHTRNQFHRHLQQLRDQLHGHDDRLFAAWLTPQRVADCARQLGCRFSDSLFTPWRTLCAFLCQLLAGRSCAFAVTQLIAYLAGSGRRRTPSPATAAYCEARARLPEGLYRGLAEQAGRDPDGELGPRWRWHGRDVRLVDGTTVTMPETAANTKEYPLSQGQKPGLSFPMLRLVVVFSLALGTALRWALASYCGKGSGEASLFRDLLDGFAAGDVVVGDRQFCSWAHVAYLVQRRQADAVVKLNASRRGNLREVRRHHRDDVECVWSRPAGCPESFTAEEFAALPAQIRVRLVRVRVNIPGFRTDDFEVLTTLLDALAFPAAELALLFRQRWQAELYLRDVKSSLGMGRLSCQSPAMVRKELLAYLLAYNIVRGQLARAAAAVGRRPYELSFRGGVDALVTFRVLWVELDAATVALVLALLGYHRVGKQPDRVEPRKVKRRQKYELLTEPRADARTKLKQKTSEKSE